MAGKPTLVLTGDLELDRMLKALPRNVQHKVIRPAFTRAARPILAAVKRNVPGSGKMHGALQAGIKSRAGKRSRKMVSRYIALPPRAVLGIAPDDKYYWPAALEYGHVVRWKTPSKSRTVQKAGGSVGWVPPHPFLRKGYDETEGRAMSIVKSEIRKNMLREAKKKA